MSFPALIPRTFGQLCYDKDMGVLLAYLFCSVEKPEEPPIPPFGSHYEDGLELPDYGDGKY